MRTNPRCFPVVCLALAAALRTQTDDHWIDTLPTTAESVSGADLTGDGIPELILGDPLTDQVLVVDGQDGRTVGLIQGPARSEFGTVAQSADSDGDGVHDVLVVGAPSANGTGQVFVYADVDLANPTATAIADGPASFGRFGDRLGVGADTNNDGYPDICVGAPFEDRPGWTDSGAVYAVDGCSGQVTLLARGAGNVAQLGWAVTEPREDLDGNAGTFHVVYTAPGSANGRGGYAKIDFVTGRSIGGGSGRDPNERMGFALAVLPDETSDSIPELCVTSPFVDVGGIPNAGKATLLDGRLGAVLREYFGELERDQIGLKAALLRGANRDLLCLTGSGGARNPGVVRFLDFATRRKIHEILGDGDNFALGNGLTVGNWNGDDVGDVAALAPGDDAVHLFSAEQLALAADRTTIDNVAGGTQSFDVRFPQGAGEPYAILGTMSGFATGFDYRGERVPLDLDPYTTLFANPLITGQLGTLDAQGHAQARFTLPPVVFSGLEITLHHAAVLFAAATPDASAAVPISIHNP